MVPAQPTGSSACPGCTGPTVAPGLCEECLDAFRVARAAHPSAIASHGVPHGSIAYDGRIGDDMDLWDAWSVVGDAGGRSGRAITD
jgi:hypothetical protein